MQYFCVRNLCASLVLAAAAVPVFYGLSTAEADSVPVRAGLTLANTQTIDPTVLKDKALQVIDTYCVSCHGPEKQKGKVRLDALETVDPVDLQKLFGSAKEAVHFEDMPPAKAKQPSEEERKVLLQWLDSQLTGDAAKALAEKLMRFEYGNVVRHEDLFSGEYADLPGYTHDRRWMISEYIFSEKVNRLLDYHPSRKIYGDVQEVAGDSGVHWSPKTEHGNKFPQDHHQPVPAPRKGWGPVLGPRTPDDGAFTDDGWQRQTHCRAYVR